MQTYANFTVKVPGDMAKALEEIVQGRKARGEVRASFQGAILDGLILLLEQSVQDASPKQDQPASSAPETKEEEAPF